jgi:hypothetical protein
MVRDRGPWSDDKSSSGRTQESADEDNPTIEFGTPGKIGTLQFDETVPVSPPGFSDVQEFVPRVGWVMKGSVYGMAAMWLVIVSAVWYLAFVAIGTYTPVGADPAWHASTSLFLSAPWRILTGLGLGVLAVATHEAVHVGVARWYGWDVLITVSHLNPQVVPLRAFQTRRETLMFNVAPLALLPSGCLGIVLLAGLGGISLPLIVVVAFLFTALITIWGAVGDLYQLFLVLTLPTGALLYNSERRTFVTVPEESTDYLHDFNDGNNQIP